MLNFDELESAGVTIKKFCGMPVEQIDENHYVACDKEAVGELTFVVDNEDGSQTPINVPVCEDCLSKMQSDGRFSIEELDNPGGILLD